MPGASGRLRDLFDWLAERGPQAESASQDAIAREVFGQDGAEADDATVRVYVHRLRKKLEDHYAAQGTGGVQVVLPQGTYALRLEGAGTSDSPRRDKPKSDSQPFHPGTLTYAGIALALLAAIALFAGWFHRDAAPNAMWQPLAASDRPVLVVLGDYYIYGEIDPVRPEFSRLIRDFRVDSAADLAALQEAEPERYDLAEDVGLNYLPFSSAYGLQSVMPVLAAMGREVEVIPASQLQPDMLNRYDLVYVGLLSGMGMLESQVFAGSSLQVGESYDELVDRQSGEEWVSDEARTLPSPVTYTDHAYVSRFALSTGAQVLVIASERETGLRGISTIVVSPDLPAAIAQAAASGPFETLVQVTGQQGADLDNRVILARPRD
ncbi:MAG: winged helix-turn-helix domain-containing protein [Erythrobacter sp.]|nr:winged helix-turn-helix domain-containing protein [Erythrobacter sp.]